MAIKFNRYFVTDGSTKARVNYSLDNRIDGRRCVTLYSQDYSDRLAIVARSPIRRRLPPTTPQSPPGARRAVKCWRRANVARHTFRAELHGIASPEAFDRAESYALRIAPDVCTDGCVGFVADFDQEGQPIDGNEQEPAITVEVTMDR